MTTGYTITATIQALVIVLVFLCAFWRKILCLFGEHEYKLTFIDAKEFPHLGNPRV